jgi:RHS repeat-associated protein
MLLAEYLPQESKYYYHTSDQVNSVRMVTDDAGAVVYSAAYAPYGQIQHTWVNTYQPKFQFSGKERESETGLDYFGARYYANGQYRFISVDPIISKEGAVSNPQLWNLYAYCRNNPVTFLDPDGRDENSLANLWKRVKIDLIAQGYDQSTAWAWDAKKDDFGEGTKKCNKFVYDVTKEAGAEALVETAPGETRPPLSIEWADKDTQIGNWRTLKEGEKTLPGDVAAFKWSSQSGHVGIMIVNKEGKLTNISAHEKIVATKLGQFENRRYTVYRRYTGN